MEMELITQGAEGRIYRGTWIGKKVIVKHRFSKKYRIPALDDHLTKERMKAEARAFRKCLSAGIRTPCVYSVDFAEREIIMEDIVDSITARNLIYTYARYQRDADKNNKGVVKVSSSTSQESDNCLKEFNESHGKNGCEEQTESEKESRNSSQDINSVELLSDDMKILGRKIGAVVGKLHKNNIIHGDLTTSNMLLVKPYERSDLILIDFGLSFIEEKVEDKAVDLYVMEKAILSTHPNTHSFVKVVLEEYSKSGGKGIKNVMKKLDEVRMRGRKKLCFG